MVFLWLSPFPGTLPRWRFGRAVALAEHHGHLGRDRAVAGETGEAKAQEVQPSYGQTKGGVLLMLVVG